MHLTFFFTFRTSKSESWETHQLRHCTPLQESHGCIKTYNRLVKLLLDGSSSSQFIEAIICVTYPPYSHHRNIMQLDKKRDSLRQTKFSVVASKVSACFSVTISLITSHSFWICCDFMFTLQCLFICDHNKRNQQSQFYGIHFCLVWLSRTGKLQNTIFSMMFPKPRTNIQVCVTGLSFFLPPYAETRI